MFFFTPSPCRSGHQNTNLVFCSPGQILAARVRSIIRQAEGQENTSTMGVGNAPVVPSSRKILDENSTLSKWICLALMALLFVPAGDDSWAFLFARATASRHHTRSFVIYHARCTNRVWSLGGFDVFCCKILDLCLFVYNICILYIYIYTYIYMCVYYV